LGKSRFAYGPFAWISKAVATIALVFTLTPAAKAEQVALVAFGDSLTQGYGLLEHEGFVPQMRDWLAAQGADVRLVNAGVSGDTTAGGAARIEWTLTDDIQGIAVAFGGNDLLRGLQPEQARANIESILKIAQTKGVQVLLVGMTAPGNYGPDYKADFDALYPDLSTQYGTLFVENFFIGMKDGAQSIDPSTVQGLMQDDGIHPNAKGVKKIVEGLGPFYLDLIKRVQGASSLEKS
jgi:acyl-CoA thioesterase-1